MTRPIILAALLALAPFAALAQSPPTVSLPDDLQLGGSLSVKLQGEVNAPQSSRARVGLYTDAELQAYANWQDWLSLNAVAKLERARNANLASYYPDRNTLLRSEVATLRQLYATVRPLPGLSLYGGKIHPNFGAAWGESMPGTFYNFASDYEQDERIGFGAAYRFSGSSIAGLDPVTLSVEVFHLDTSVLSYTFPRGPSLLDPTASRAWRLARGQFGPSNTGGLDSFTLSARGGRRGQGLVWQASYTQEATRDPEAAAQRGHSVSVSYDPTGSGIPLTPRLAVTPFVEYAHLSNAQTIRGLERHYVLAGLAFTQGDWTLALAAGVRESRGAERASDQQQNITLTRDLGGGFKLGLGVNHVRISGRQSWSLAPTLSYDVAF